MVVGGGFAGFWAAVAARRVAGPAHAIEMISASEQLQVRPRLYEADPARFGVALQPLLDVVDVDFRHGRVSEIDVVARTVGLESADSATFDRLVVATGSRMTRPPIPGIDEAFSIDTLDEAVAFDEALARACHDHPDGPVVAVVGAGFTGIELALELRSRMDDHRDGSGGGARVVLVDRSAEVGAGLGSGPRPVIEAALRDNRVELHLGVQLAELDGTELQFGDGSTLDADLVVLTTGLRATDIVRQLPGTFDDLGRVYVDEDLSLAEAPFVFAAGDAAAAHVGAGRLALQSCQHALQNGRHAGENAARSLLGSPLLPYSQERYVTCLDLGPSGAVLTEGWDRTVVSTGDEAHAVKRRINESVIYPPDTLDPDELLAASVLDWR